MPEDKTEQDLPRLTTIKQNDIVKIEVLRKNLDNFEFNKQDEVWQMNLPQQFLANSARINAMLHILDAESHGQLNPAEVDLARFDLIDPIITLKLNDHVFQFGNTDAIDQRRYVLFDGTIYLTNDSLYTQLTTNAAFFADTKILPLDFEISAIQFPENKMELHGGQWQLQNLMDISPDQLKQIVFAWNNAAAISVNKYSEPDSVSSIIASSANGKTIEFIVVSTEPHLILGRKDLGIQYHLGSDESKKLLLKEKVETPQQTQQQ
ncbi:MAG: hypothetical protein DHS20C09_15930 [marine bacterium B5-7]|nr:MAG: hypothetical protein DHS20C09_15930 [marine bacterium B5-7]